MSRLGRSRTHSLCLGLEKAANSTVPVRSGPSLQSAPVSCSPGEEYLLGRAHRGP